jgi:hypothetical protein
MLSGVDSLGAISFGADDLIDLSTVSLLDQARLSGALPVLIIRAYPFDPVTALPVEVRGAQEGTALSLTKSYPGVVLEILNVETDISQADLTTALGGIPTRSSIRYKVKQNEGDSDVFESYDWSDRPIETYRGYEGLPESEFELVRTDHVKCIRLDELGFWIDMQDPSLDLQVPLQQSFYAGTAVQGGTTAAIQIEGDENLADKPRPIGLGPVRNATGVLVDRIARVYQCSDRQIRRIDMVRDKGLDEASGGLIRANGGANDITDLALADIWAWTPVPGAWISDLSKALYRLGSEPVGEVTVDFQGYGPPSGSTDIEFTQTIPHGTFDVTATLDEFDYIGTGWVDKIAVP